MRPVAIIESNTAARAELRNAVEDAGFRTDCFGDGLSALAMLRKRPFSLAILELDVHQDDAFAVCREISRVVPLIIVTSECDAETCVRALESGADDCVTRPLPARELVARMRNVLRRADAAPEAAGSEALSISIREMRVRNGNTTHELSRGEAELLALLIEHAPRPLSPARIGELLRAKPETVRSRIKSLRRKLGPARLANRSRLGYYLIVD